MDVFKLRNSVITDYSAYVRSFLTIKDERISRLVREEMDGGFLWPDPLIQLNPSFEAGETLQQLIDNAELNPECINIFRDKREDGTAGAPFRLHNDVASIRPQSSDDVEKKAPNYDSQLCHWKAQRVLLAQDRNCPILNEVDRCDS